MACLKENVLDCQVASDEETAAMIKTVFKWSGSDQHATDGEVSVSNYVICPHTAVAFVALLKHAMVRIYELFLLLLVNFVLKWKCWEFQSVWLIY